jgi:hypothetical protein
MLRTDVKMAAYSPGSCTQGELTSFAAGRQAGVQQADKACSDTLLLFAHSKVHQN